MGICFLFVAFAFGEDTPVEKDELKPAVFAKGEANATDFDDSFIEASGEEAGDFEEDKELDLLEENEADVEGVDTTNSTGEEVFAKNESAPIEFVEEEKGVEGKLPKDDTLDHKAVMSEEAEIANFGEAEELVEVDGKLPEDDTEDHDGEFAPDDFEEEA